MQKYPYNEGDDYFTIEGIDIVISCWDDVSEEMYRDDPNKKYFSTRKKAKKALIKKLILKELNNIEAWKGEAYQNGDDIYCAIKKIKKILKTK